jgi:hypothetical protein
MALGIVDPLGASVEQVAVDLAQGSPQPA